MCPTTRTPRRLLLTALVFSLALGLFAADASAMHHPTTGRWLSRDPAGYVDGQNLYLYGVGDPVGRFDPTGQGVLQWLFGWGYPRMNCDVSVRRLNVVFWRRSPKVAKKSDKDLTGNKRGKLKKTEKQVDIGHTWIEYPAGDDSMGFWPATSGWTLTKPVPGDVMQPDPKQGYYPDVKWEALVEQNPSRTLKHGKSKGTTCDCVTCGEVYDCMQEVARLWDGTPWRLLTRNCRTFVETVVGDCCMDD